MKCNLTDMTIISNCNNESLLNTMQNNRCKKITSVVFVLKFSTFTTLKLFTVTTANVYSDMLTEVAIITDSPRLIPRPQHFRDSYD